jgi:hypothetical protein
MKNSRSGFYCSSSTHKILQPTFSVPLSLDDRTHEDLDRADITERDLALISQNPALDASWEKRRVSSAYLSCGLVESKVMPQLLLANSSGCVNLVAEDQEWNLRELLDGQESVKLCF